jgi:hypothetical protein
MKLKLIIFFICIFFSCKKEITANTSTTKSDIAVEKKDTDTILFNEFGNKKLIDFNFPNEWKVNTYHDENINLSDVDIESAKQLIDGDYFKHTKGKKLTLLEDNYINTYIKNDTLLRISKLDSIFVLDSIITANKKLLFIKSFSILNDEKYEAPLVISKIDLILINKNSFAKSINLYLEIDYPFLSKKNISYLNKKGVLYTKKFEIDEEKTYYRGMVTTNCNEYFTSFSELKASNQINKKYQGKFSSTVDTDATTSGNASITYNFTISTNKVLLETSTYHEPISCNGEYKAIEKENILELYYKGNENSCKSLKPSFKIKEEGEKYYIKGTGGEATYNEWIFLNKK